MPGDVPSRREVSRRQLLAAVGGALGAAASASVLAGHLWPHMTREDLIPGTAPDPRDPENLFKTSGRGVSSMAQ